MRAFRLDAITTSAPSRAAACAVAKPMPELPPSTTMRFPFSVMTALLLL